MVDLVDVVKIKSAELNKKGLTCDHSWRQANNTYVKRLNPFMSLQDLLLSLEKTVTSNLFHFTFNRLLQGVSRPTKYHLLWNDDDDMKTDELEQLTYYLCHMFSRCTRSVSYPAPTYNAHLAAYRARVYLEGWVCSCCNEMNRSEKCTDYCTWSIVVAGKLKDLIQNVMSLRLLLIKEMHVHSIVR
jgi:hypothetical protein